MLNDFGDRIDCRQKVIWSDCRAYNGLIFIFGHISPMSVCVCANRSKSSETTVICNVPN